MKDRKGMSEPHVTITLGRSGQRVVKGSWGSTGDDRFLCGGKRSLEDSFGSNASKRLREEFGARNSGYNSYGKRLGPKDLRVKLTKKRMLRRAELEIEERKKRELHNKLQRAVRSAECPERSLQRSSTPGDELLHMKSFRSSHASWTSDGVRPRSPDRVVRSSNQTLAPRSGIDVVSRVPSTRPILASKTGNMLAGDCVDPSRPRVPLPMTSRGALDAGRVVNQLPPLPPLTVGVPRAPNPDGQPLSVSSLLHSLGLAKYVIHFQAEEIDMPTLMQMGERDLKELGIPMGPRKKILLALVARTKCSAT